MFYDQYVRLCEDRGEKPTPVAQKLGCSSSNVALWKKGSTPRPAVLSKIADYFGVTTQFLLFGETDDPTPGIKKDTIQEDDVDGEAGKLKAEIMGEMSDFSKEELALVLTRIRKVKESRG